MSGGSCASQRFRRIGNDVLQASRLFSTDPLAPDVMIDDIHRVADAEMKTLTTFAFLFLSKRETLQKSPVHQITAPPLKKLIGY